MTIRFHELRIENGQKGFFHLISSELPYIPPIEAKIHYSQDGVDYVFEIIDIHIVSTNGAVEINLKRIGTNSEYNSKKLRSL